MNFKAGDYINLEFVSTEHYHRILEILSENNVSHNGPVSYWKSRPMMRLQVTLSKDKPLDVRYEEARINQGLRRNELTITDFGLTDQQVSCEPCSTCDHYKQALIDIQNILNNLAQ